MRRRAYCLALLALVLPAGAQQWAPASSSDHGTFVYQVRPFSSYQVWVHLLGAADVDVRWVSFHDRRQRVLADNGSITEQRAQIDIATGLSDTIETARGDEVTYLTVEVTSRRTGDVVQRRAMRFVNDGNPKPAPSQE